jgi:hypothetical protein
MPVFTYPDPVRFDGVDQMGARGLSCELHAAHYRGQD